MDNIDQYIDEINRTEDFFAKAKLLQHLTQVKNIRIVDLSKKLGIKPSYICHILRLNRIPEMVVDGFYGKQISISHLFIISRLKESQKIVRLYEKILSENLTVIRTEEAVREMIYQTKTTGDRLTAEEITRYINTIKSEYNNAGVKIIQTRIKSKLVIEMKGSLKETTGTAKKILNRLTP